MPHASDQGFHPCPDWRNTTRLLRVSLNVTNDARDVSALRAARLRAGLSLRQVAQRASMNPGHLSRVERGQEGLSTSSLRRLAQVIGLNELAAQLAEFDRQAA